MADEIELREELSMKPLLAVAIHEAVKLALIDCVLADGVDAACGGVEAAGIDRWIETSDRLQREWRHDVYSMPAGLLAGMDPVALGQNVCVRLLGTGGWQVNGVYGPNASAREVLDACLERPDQNAVDELAFDMGLQPADDEPARPSEEGEERAS